MIGFQAAEAAPIVKNKIVENPETVATAIRIGNPASWQGATNAIVESQGLIDSVTDQEILSAHKLLALREGIFVEPASAASIAGVLKYKSMGLFKSGDIVVCVLTGNGLKDQENAIKHVAKPIKTLAEKSAVLEIINS